MAEFESLKKKLFTNNCSVEDLLQLDKLVKKELLKPSVSNELPKLLAGAFKYSLHKDVKYRNASIPTLKNLVGQLDMNKHLKNKSWWTEMKEEIIKRLDNLAKIMNSGDESGTVVWCEIVKMLGTDLKAEIVLLNRLLKMAESLFKANENIRLQAFQCWRTLIDNFSINKQEMNNRKRLNLLVIPLKAKNHTTKELCAAKFETWKHLLTKINQHNEITVELVVSNFLQYMFSSIGSLPPVCTKLESECAAVFLQLLKTANLFHIGQLPQLMITHSLTCIKQIHTKDPSLSVKIWQSLLGNISQDQWPEKHVTQLMSCLSQAGQNEALARNQVFAELIHCLYAVPHPMPSALLMQHYGTLLLLILQSHVLIHFTETWCNELFDVWSSGDHIQISQNILSEIIHKLPALTASEMFREEKSKLLRSIWMEVTHVFCKFISDDAQMSKNIDGENEINNANILLSFGAAELSSRWNKAQMKSWKVLYSESVKFCSLMPEADKFISDLMDSLLKGVRLAKIPLHVAVDLSSIILDLHLSKDTANILQFLLEIAEKGIISLLNDVSGTSTVLNQYLKTIVTAARNEASLINDVLLVIDKMVDELPISEKFRSMVLKAQHQLQSLKPGRVQDKSLSPGGTSVQQTTSPTVTSFLHRLAKAKESKSKMASPTSSQASEKSSPICHTPNSKKTSSPFIDEKSEDFVFVPPKTRKTILTDHQKEAFTARKNDIPALYQDLSQDSSQSALESIVTSVKTFEEDVDKVKVLRSPKKQSHTFELGLKVITPKKISNDSIGITKPNFKDSCEPTQIIKQNSSPDSLLDDDENHDIRNKIKISPLKSNSQNKNESPMKKSDLETSIPSLCSGMRKSPNKGEHVPAQINTESAGANLKTTRDLLEPQPMVSLFGKFSTTKPTSNGSNTDKNMETPKLCEVITLHSSESENDNDSVENKSNSNTPKTFLTLNKITPLNKKEQNKEINQPNPSPNSKSQKSPKISPRRLRKRKSGLTPILAVDSIKKKKLSLTRSPASCKNTPTSTQKGPIPNKEVKRDEVVVQIEPLVENCSMENEKNHNTPNDKLIIRDETSPSELSKIKEELKEYKKTVVCSPVKVILERVQMVETNPTLKCDSICKDQNINASSINKKSNSLEKETPAEKEKPKDLGGTAEITNTTSTPVPPQKGVVTSCQSTKKQTNLAKEKSPTDDFNRDDITKPECTSPVTLRLVESKTRTSERITSINSKKTSKVFSDVDNKIKETLVQSTDESSSYDNQTDCKNEKNKLRQKDQSKCVEMVVSGDKPEITSVDSNVTPVKRGHKNLKQTQLPFTPVGKCPDSKSEEKECTLSTSPKKLTENNLDSGCKKEDSFKKCPHLILDKLNIPEKVIDNRANSVKPATEQDGSISSNTDSSRNACEEVPPCDADVKSSTTTKQGVSTRSQINNQDAQKTPEKISSIQSSCSKNMTLATEIPASDDSIIESPVKPTESEDIIASSQENVVRPTSVSFKIANSLSPPKLLSKSPKKVHILSESHNNVSDRMLRSSPSKTDSSRVSSTPIKKSVCRRLDVGIEDNLIEVSKLRSSIPEDSKEMENNLEATNKLNENKFQEKSKSPDKNYFGSTIEKIGNVKDDIRLTSPTSSPTCSKGLKRVVVESNSSQIESPKRLLGPLRLENVGSPKSPSSRTNQMMELVMQDQEKTISSPNSLKKRRILPIRLGPVSRTPKIQSPTVVVRAHNGPSEDWVRRIYSPTASPNSSILKRKVDAPLDSPDSSPPSSKKKRVSFLDPPVSESLLFSSADPGKGQVQRLESKKENESEEVPTQGSVQLDISPEKFNSDVKIFSPLKECDHPITNILERIGSDQWLSELESGLERLGVTSIGHFCSLSEATVQRLPFRYTDVGKLRKILQNYYDETCDRMETSVQESENNDNTIEDLAVPSVSDANEDIQVLPEEESKSAGNAVDVKELAEHIKKSLKEYPDLIPALGSTLNICDICDMLKCAMDKLPNC